MTPNEQDLTNPLRIIADIPTSRPGLGFPEYVEALADAVRGGEPPQFTIGLYGPWGSGKSSLLIALRDSLSRSGDEVIPVLFDAWRYERSDHIVVPLLHAVYASVSELGNNELAKVLRRALESIVFSLNFSLGGLGIDLKSAKQAWEDSGLAPLDSAFSRPFTELRKAPAELKGKRIAVLVDDLDRCSSGHVVELLEAINLIMDVPGFVFVLALDYDVVVNAVQERYPHASGHAFIQKIVQLPFRVPSLEVNASNFADVVPQWVAWSSNLPQAFVDCAAEISITGLRGNPRQVKRFLNSFVVIHRIIQSRRLVVDYEQLAAVIGLQLAWPERYRLVQEALGVGESDPLAPLRQAATEDPWLDRYMSRFFGTEEVPINQLRTLLQLTAVVAAGEAEVVLPLPGQAQEARIRNRDKMVTILKAQKYEQDKEDPYTWYSTKDRDWRFFFKIHTINLQKRDGDRWILYRSYLLTREISQAMQAARTPKYAPPGSRDSRPPGTARQTSKPSPRRRSERGSIQSADRR
jgi:KAP family P-loop domain